MVGRADSTSGGVRAHGQVVGDLVDDLRDAVARGEGLSLVAEEQDQIVGHVLFSPSLLDAPKRLVPVQVLSPIGVVPARQSGVGTARIRHGLELLIGRNVPLVCLEGPPAYDSRFAFQCSDRPGVQESRLCGSRTQRSRCSDSSTSGAWMMGSWCTPRRLEARRSRASRPRSLGAARAAGSDGARRIHRISAQRVPSSPPRAPLASGFRASGRRCAGGTRSSSG